MSLRDAVAATFRSCRNVIFTGNGYSTEWPVEAQKRGLPNLNTTPLAIDSFTDKKNQEALSSMKVLSYEESAALAETMYENYITTLSIEVDTLLQMVSTGFLPAFAKDLATYKDAPGLAGERSKLYATVKAEAEKLKEINAAAPHGLKEEAAYLCNKVKPQMDTVRQFVDEAESLMEAAFYLTQLTSSFSMATTSRFASIQMHSNYNA